MLTSLQQILDEAQKKTQKTVVIAQAADKAVLTSADEAVKQNLADFILVANPARILPIIEELELDWAKEAIIAVDDDTEAARKAVAEVSSGSGKALMKGNLQTGVFLKAVLDKEHGLRSGHLMSQCGVYDNPLNGKLLLITDCAMNIAPDIEQKKQIIENAVGLALKLGIEMPKVAVLAALETINTEMQETVDAAVLSKMAERGQIKNCIVDGPFAMDNALSAEAARHKAFYSPVAGNLDVLLVPDLKTGNAIHKAITYLTPIKNAALCLGTTAPVIMTSRTDHIETKLLSIALGCIVA